MPRDTVRVFLHDESIKFKVSDYYNPLLLYSDGSIKSAKVLHLTIDNYQKKIRQLNCSDSITNFFLRSVNNFFSQGALNYVALMTYTKVSEVKEYLNRNRHPFLVFLIDYSSEYMRGSGEVPDPNVGTALHKAKIEKEKQAQEGQVVQGERGGGMLDGDDFMQFLFLDHFVVLPTITDDVPQIFRDSPKLRERVIFVYEHFKEGGAPADLYLKFVSQYLFEAFKFHAVNPYGLELNTEPIFDDDLIEKLRINNINFYSQLNETGSDGITGFKEGVDLAGIPIDKTFTLALIKDEATRELISTWKENYRLNSKLSALQLMGERPSIYSSRLETKLNKLIERGYIVDFYGLKLQVHVGSGLLFKISVTVKYNDSVNTLVFDITNESSASYLERMSSEAVA